MKVLHVIVDLDVGGAEMALYRLLTPVSSPTGERVVISLTTVGVIGERLRQRGIEVHALGMVGGRDALKASRGLYRFMRQYQPDVVQTWMYHADLIGGITAKLAGVKRIIWGVRTFELDASAPRVTRVVRFFCAQMSSWLPSSIVCVAHSAMASHIRIGYAAERMCVIPNGYDFARFSAASSARGATRALMGVRPNEILIGSVGRLHPDKNHEMFLAAISRVLREYSAVKVAIIGRGLDFADNVLSRMIRSRGMQNRVLLLGERADVPECLAAMDIYCLHSRREAFPNALAEAMASGLPCVATDVGDVRQLLADVGRIVPEGDEHALANALSELVGMTDAARRELGRHAAAKVRRDFSLEAYRLRFENLYSSEKVA